jgi:hypothetical protein
MGIPVPLTRYIRHLDRCRTHIRGFQIQKGKLSRSQRSACSPSCTHPSRSSVIPATRTNNVPSSLSMPLSGGHPFLSQSLEKYPGARVPQRTAKLTRARTSLGVCSSGDWSPLGMMRLHELTGDGRAPGPARAGAVSCASVAM